MSDQQTNSDVTEWIADVDEGATEMITEQQVLEDMRRDERQRVEVGQVTRLGRGRGTRYVAI